MRQNGAHQNDPVRFRYLESFEQRLRAKGGLHKGTTHWRKLEQAISDYQARLDSAGQRDEPTPDVGGNSPLSGLLDQLNETPPEASVEAPQSVLEQWVFGQSPQDPPKAHPASAPNNPRPPLKAMIRAQANQGHHVIAERIRHAIESTPKEAGGPMNAHRLVSRAIAEMKTLSPEYLARFARYTDTLLTLERLARKG